MADHSAKWRRAERCAGTVLMEFVLAFPLVLTLMLAIIQFAHIAIARQVVHYAAYMAARVALVSHWDEAPGHAREAAARICSAITLSESLVEYQQRIAAAGGDAAAFGAARRKTEAILSQHPDAWNITATVEHDFALIVPVVGAMIGRGLTLWGDGALQETPDPTGDMYMATDAVNYPHIRLNATVILPKPYRTVVRANY